MQRTKVNPFLIVTLLAVLILCTNTARAQYYRSGSTFFGGFLLGTNFAQVDGDNFAGYRKIGLNAGAIVHTRVGDQSSISVSLLYSEKGSLAGKGQLPVRGLDQSTLISEYNILLQTAEIPINYNYFFPDKKSIISAGLSYAQLVNATAVVNGVATDDQFPFNSYDLALNLGACYKLYKRFYVNCRFQNSLLNIREIHDPRVERASQTNRSLSVRLMYLIKSDD